MALVFETPGIGVTISPMPGGTVFFLPTGTSDPIANVGRQLSRTNPQTGETVRPYRWARIRLGNNQPTFSVGPFEFFPQWISNNVFANFGPVAYSISERVWRLTADQPLDIAIPIRGDRVRWAIRNEGVDVLAPGVTWFLFELYE